MESIYLHTITTNYYIYSLIASTTVLICGYTVYLCMDEAYLTSHACASVCNCNTQSKINEGWIGNGG